MSNNRRNFIRASLSVLAIVLVATAGWIWFEHHAVTPQTAKPAVTKSNPAKPQLDRLQIEAIRERSYPGSVIRDEGGQVISYLSDGFKVRALLSIPAGTAPPGGWPVIILNHGYINPAIYRTTGPEYQEFINAFAGAGYAVFKPDYRGHDQSEGVPEGGHFSPVYAYDDLNLISSIKQDKRFNPKRIGLFGHSFGGHLSLRVIVVSKDIKATVIMAGVVGSFEDIFYNWPNSPRPYDQPQIVQDLEHQYVAKYGEPKTNPDFWNSVSAINYVSAISGPVQIHHSDTDAVVPKAFSDHLDQALKAAGKRDEYYVYHGDDHNLIRNRQTIIARAIAFYRANL